MHTSCAAPCQDVQSASAYVAITSAVVGSTRYVHEGTFLYPINYIPLSFNSPSVPLIQSQAHTCLSLAVLKCAMQCHYCNLCCYHLLCVVLSTSCWLTKVSPGGNQGLHQQSLLPWPRWSSMIQGICKMVLPKWDYSIPILTPFLSSHSCKSRDVSLLPWPK